MKTSRIASLRKGLSLSTYHVRADTLNVNFYNYVVALGYVAGPCILILDAGVEIYSSDPTIPAFTYGGWPAGTTPAFVNKGTVTGAGGAGGNGAIPAVASAGQKGGDAVYMPAAAGFTPSLDNSAGTLRGGGGGGGGGDDFDDVDAGAGGGGGGGGRGRIGGMGGIAGPNGTNGVAGTTAAAGAGGAGGTSSVPNTGAAGGAGGGYGAVGTAGTNGGGSNPPGAGGAAGNAINGMGNLTVVGAAGTRTGPVV